MHRMLNLELASDVELEACKADDDGQVWTILLSSGQIRHNKSGKCLGVYFDNNTPHLKAQDCTIIEKQTLTQRWMLPFYQMPDFTEGSGQIELGYGHQSQEGYCLSTSGTSTLEVVKCKSGASTFKVETATDPHAWAHCASDGANCACIGEIRYGNSEGNSWSSGVPVPNEFDTVADVKCDVARLRDIAIRDPVSIPDIDYPDLRHCQCRGAKPTTVAEVEEVEEKSSNTGLIIGGAVGGVALLGIAGYFATKKPGGDHLLDGEEEEWEEEEEGGEEYEEYEE